MASRGDARIVQDCALEPLYALMPATPLRVVEESPVPRGLLGLGGRLRIQPAALTSIGWHGSLIAWDSRGQERLGSTVNAADHRWAVVIPTGSSVSASAADSQIGVIPRQYRSPRGGQPLIWDAICRARKVVAHERTCVVVQSDQRRFWTRLRSQVPSENLLQQPRDRGTATGILFALVRILGRDPLAQVIFVPAEQSFENEVAVSFCLNRTLARISCARLELMVIAVDAERAASDLAYIVPGARLQPDVYQVKEFLDRPGPDLAQRLCAGKALCSTLLFGAWGFSVLALFQEHLPGLVDAMSSASAQAVGLSRPLDRLAELYERLPATDFAQFVMPKARSMMQVVHGRDFGWTELGAEQTERSVPIPQSTALVFR
jgi:mannose-1-phosphate guanylyltransferase